MKILYNAKDHPSISSGYGIITRYLTPLLGRRYGKKRIFLHCPVYQKGSQSEYEGMVVLPGGKFDFDEDVCLMHYQEIGADMLIMVGDVWPICQSVIPKAAAEDKIYWIQWCAFDFLPPFPDYVLEGLRHCHKIVPFSKWGETLLREQGFTNVTQAIWPGLNTELWKPYSRDAFPKTAKSLGFEPDAYNILICAANQGRKYYPEHFEGIRIFREKHPEVKLRLYVHSQPRADRDLLADFNYFKLGDITRLPDEYTLMCGNYSEWDMVRVFASADVCLSAALEGFGYATVQAQAVGVPVIALNYGVSQELVHSGTLVPVKDWDMQMGNLKKVVPSEEGIAKALEEIWMRGPDRTRWAKGAQWIQENLSWEKIAQEWYRVIDECAAEKMKGCVTIPEPSPLLDRKAQKVMQFG